MSAVAWSDDFAVVDSSVWTTGGYGVLPTAIGGGKIRLAWDAGAPCQMCHIPFGAEGSLAARSVALSYTVYPAECSGNFYLAVGNKQAQWPEVNPHPDSSGFGFLDLPSNVKFLEDRGMYVNNGNLSFPINPFEVRVSAYLDVAAQTVRNCLVVDGVVIMDEVVQTSAYISWNTYLNQGYSLPFIRQDENGATAVIGSLSGIIGGTPEENRAFVMAPALSTLSPNAQGLSGGLISLSAPSNFPILFSRVKSDIPSRIPSSLMHISALGPIYYSSPFQATNGETIYVSSVVGNLTPSGFNGYAVTEPKAVTVSLPPPIFPVVKTWTR